MKEYLLDLFRYNDWANKKLSVSILQLKEKEEAVKLFSHLISTQNKWLNRITKEMDDAKIQWFDEPIKIDSIEKKWDESIGTWIHFLENCSENEIEEYLQFTRQSDGVKMGIKIKDLALQINLHSVHHRAQINSLLSKQGIKPPATDYILTKLQEMS